MTIGSHRETAKIYQFPVKARTAAGAQRDKTDRQTQTDLPYVCASAFDNWYHEAAIEEEAPPRKQ